MDKTDLHDIKRVHDMLIVNPEIARGILATILDKYGVWNKIE